MKAGQTQPHILTLSNLENVSGSLKQQMVTEVSQVLKHVVAALPHALKHHVWVVG